MPDSHVFDSKAGNEKVATSEADEWAGKCRDVAGGTPGLYEQIPICDQGEVEVKEQTQNRNPDNPECQWRLQVRPPDPKDAPQKHGQEYEEKQGPGNVPDRDCELRVDCIDRKGQAKREGDNGCDC